MMTIIPRFASFAYLGLAVAAATALGCNGANSDDPNQDGRPPYVKPVPVASGAVPYKDILTIKDDTQTFLNHLESAFAALRDESTLTPDHQEQLKRDVEVLCDEIGETDRGRELVSEKQRDFVDALDDDIDQEKLLASAYALLKAIFVYLEKSLADDAPQRDAAIAALQRTQEIFSEAPELNLAIAQLNRVRFPEGDE